MKKNLISLLLCAVLLTGLCSTAYADPSPSPETQPSPTPASSFELIKFKDYGEPVVRIQLRLRELGYFDFKPTGNFQAMTVDAAIRFQQMQVDANGQSIIADGTIGAQSMAILFSTDAKRAEITATIPFGPSLNGTAEHTGELVNWSVVKNMLTVGGIYKIIDYNTATEFNMTYVGGENHAEMECPNAAQTEICRTSFGGEFNYSKRPVLVEIDGQLIAASLQGFPHGDDSVPGNDMDGHSCLFFDGSLSHVGNLPDAEHLKQIYKAAGRG